MPIVDGKTLIGWGAVRETPLHFAGLFASQGEAQLKAEEMGDGYDARQDTPDTFATGEAIIFTAIAGSIFEPLPTDYHSNRFQVVAKWINRRIARLRRPDQ